MSSSVKLSVTNYLIEICPTLLSVSKTVIQNHLTGGSKFQSKSDVEAAITAFCNEGSVRLLLVGKQVAKLAEVSSQSEQIISVRTSLDKKTTGHQLIAVLKRPHITTLEEELEVESPALVASEGDEGVRRPLPLAQKLQVASLSFGDSEVSALELLQNLLQNSIEPLLLSEEMCTVSEQRAEDEGGRVTGQVRKKLQEFVVTVQQAQQAGSIAAVELVCDPRIIECVNKAREEGRKASLEDLGALASDTRFLNKLQQQTNSWQREISKVVSSDRDMADMKALNEVTFWSTLESALKDIADRFQTPEVEFQLTVLNENKRCMFFEQGTGVQRKLEDVSSVNQMMKDFPINDLLSASTLEELKHALQAIFTQFRKLKNAHAYPISRAWQLVEAISRDLTSQMMKILAAERLMEQDDSAFDHNVQQCSQVFQTWDEELRRMRELSRSLAKQRGLPPPPSTSATNYEHTLLKERLDNISRLRQENAKFRQVIAKVMLAEGGTQAGTYKELTNAMKPLQLVDLFDLSKAGRDSWEGAKKQYQNKLDKVETGVINKIREQLVPAVTGNEMFRVFQEYNPLFFRPKIRNAVQEYQADLIEQVKRDFKALQTKHRDGFSGSETSVVAAAFDLPPSANFILWARSLEERVSRSLKRMGDILGRNWDEHREGQRLKSEALNFTKSLSSDQLFVKWQELMKSRHKFDTSAKVLVVRSLGPDRYELDLNCDPLFMELWKEVRFMVAAELKPPFSLKASSDDSRMMYPAYVILQEAVRANKQLSEKLAVDPRFTSMVALLAGEQQAVQTQITKGLQMMWHGDQFNAFTQQFTAAVESFDRKLSELGVVASEMDTQFRKLRELNMKSDENQYRKIAESIQSLIDQLLNEGYSNISDYVAATDKALEVCLMDQLIKTVETWIRECSTEWPKRGTTLISDGSLHHMDMRGRDIVLLPSADASRQHLMGLFHKFVSKFTSLPRPTIVGSKACATRATYRDLLEKLPADLIQRCYSSIDELVQATQKEVERWFSYSALWDIDMVAFSDTLEGDLEAWSEIISEMKDAKSSLARVKDRQFIGPNVIETQQLVNKIERQYKLRIEDMIGLFAQRVSESIVTIYNKVSSARDELEKQGNLTAKLASIDPQSLSGLDEQTRLVTTEIGQYVEHLRGAKQTQEEWGAKVKLLAAGEKVLRDNGHRLPQDWIYAERVQGEWASFEQVLLQQASFFETNKDELKKLVSVIDKKLQEALDHIQDDWKQKKPVGGETAPQEALKVLDDTEMKMKMIIQRFEKLDTAKSVLGLPVGVRADISGFDPRILQEEVSNLKVVWSELGSLHHSVVELKSTAWASIVPKKIRETIEHLLSQVKLIPVRYRQYEAFERLQDDLKSYLSLNQMINELRSETLKERHWKKILENLNIRKSYQELTLGDIYDSRPKAHEEALKDILNRAQGESGLSEFLTSVKEIWSTMEFTFIPYKTKYKLISGFDDIFQVLDEHLNLLQSMRMSPYFSSFEEEATSWDDKLSRLRGLLDVWLEVQRKWLYLEGVFTGSADIQALLPSDFSKFKEIDMDLYTMMKRMSKKIIDIVNQEGLLKSLTRLSESLTRVQKALSDYLEKQRTSFPRFYFVGDEDLLEMIGNAKDPLVVQRHLNKMFAGITSLAIDPESPQTITGMISREGELVSFVHPLEISPTTSLMTWLTALEKNMVFSLATLLSKSLEKLPLEVPNKSTAGVLFNWMTEFPTQIVILSIQIRWTQWVEVALKSSHVSEHIRNVCEKCKVFLSVLADNVLSTSDKISRTKTIQLITEVVHQRDVCVALEEANVQNALDFAWLQYMRFYYDPREDDERKRLVIKMANAEFDYGYEYLGVSERLVQTPLTDKCYLTLTQALHLRLGGNPFGPAGTGKTETVKFLGSALGRFVLVFNCDEAFDFHAMGRIFVGLCEVGAWGCFDEFNRLEERMLSAVSEQILTIQTGLREKRAKIDLLNQNVHLSPNVGIFVTMNPGYAGRSNLPDNLKQLFREFAMIVPDKSLITEVLLYSQGFETANKLASKIVSLFELCFQQLSQQPHYDFGLRSLKSVLSSAGQLKRKQGDKHAEENVGDQERKIILRSVCDSLVPKLVQKDVPRLQTILSSVFPGAVTVPVEEALLETEIIRLCEANHYETESTWIQKILQLYQIQKLSHGVMLVGPTGVGKSSAWQILLAAMEKVDNTKGLSYIIDPKALSKEQLYGKLDATTLEWTDGVFTATLRKIINASMSKVKMRHWIIFDGDVDPEWAENLNSVLDDNKLLTLPNGERFQVPANVRLVFEVDTLKSATLATVSRCGMVWMSDSTLSLRSIFSHHIALLGGAQHKSQNVTEDLQRLASSTQVLSRTETLDNSNSGINTTENQMEEASGLSAVMRVQQRQGATKPSAVRGVTFARDVYRSTETASRIRDIAATCLAQYFEQGGPIMNCLEAASTVFHIMDFTTIRVIEALFSILERQIISLIDLQEDANQASAFGQDQPLPQEHVETYILRLLPIAVCWAFGGSMPLAGRTQFASTVAKMFARGPVDIALPPSALSGDDNTTLLDYTVVLSTGEWQQWKEGVPENEIEPRQVEEATLVIETSDTRSHREVIGTYLQDRRPFILCGPPGSGKTMTLLSTLKAHQSDYEVASLNFSSGTTPDMLLKTFNHYCEYVKTSNGTVLRPTATGKWLILFCDEINLPATDQYGTQRVISFMRQLCFSGTFWKMTSQGVWELITLERVQFAGACNPPTDAGRHPMANRFLRGAPILFVDFPGFSSLKRIYGTFNRAMLRPTPLRDLANSLTDAMVEFYTASQQNFTVDVQPHYIYSPRELSRWKVALNEAIKERSDYNARDLVRLAIHEAERIFRDRLVDEEHQTWTDERITSIFLKHFPNLSVADLAKPILFSTYITGRYEESSTEALQDFIEGKMQVFYEEEVAVKLVLFNECLHHILRIDRVLRQPLGHLLLVGVSGSGKTILSKFVAWLNGLSVFQIKAGRNYDTVSFETDLRTVMKRAGVKEEKICFIFDESNVLGPAFLERMNALLAAGEVPGLFEQDEFTQLINECRGAFGAELDDTECFNRFTKQVQRNLHIVFTMNPANPDFYNRQATSPALFNRCVIDWFGDWPEDALIHVAREFTDVFDVPALAFTPQAQTFDESERRDFLARSIVGCHQAVDQLNQWLAKQGKRRNFVAPRDYLDFIRHLLGFVGEKRDEVSETTHHLTMGLSKLAETEAQVAELQLSLAQKETELAEKQKLSEEKMQDMIRQKGEAEEKKKHAEQLAQELDAQESSIKQQKSVVEAELSEVEPLLAEAKESVQSIPKRALDELRGMQSPPSLVKLCCEAVIVLLSNSGEKGVSWEDVRKAMRQDFIQKILTFDPTKKEALSSATVRQIKTKYLGNPEWNYERIDKASKAAGPLSKWAASSISYAEIILKVDPLREEIEILETKLSSNQKRLVQTNQLIDQLETRLSTLQREYADLIAAEQQIKREMEGVKKKVVSSKVLLSNLTAEQERWSASCQVSKAALSTEIGDNVLAAAFSTYIGFFEQSEREKLTEEWHHVLEQNQIQFQTGLSMIEYLSKPVERYNWLANGLPSDDLSMENTVILRRFIRYPLIIDPSGQATDFIMSLYSERKIVKTSFSDPGFVKQLESALRFGTALLVQDVEEMDTILNNVLNQETHKQGGRALITVGENEVDFSPSFIIFLVTRDPTVQFTPDLASRVTLINYTTTPASLRNQCLNLVLKSERPDVDKKRRDVLKLQGEFRVKLRELEDKLLTSLSNVSGNILDDERVISTLESLKAQAEEVNKEAARADQIVEEVEKTTAMYIPLADAAARLYSTLEHLSSLYFLYHYDLRFFETVFKETLNDKTVLSSVSGKDYSARAEILLRQFFKNFYDRCSLSQLHKDKIVLALQFARIRFESMTKISLRSNELDVLLQGKFPTQATSKGRAPLRNASQKISAQSWNSVLGGRLTLEQIKSLQNLSALEPFNILYDELNNNSEFWYNWLNASAPETIDLPPALTVVSENEEFLQLPHFETLREDLKTLSVSVIRTLRRALVIRALRPDRLSVALDSFISCIMGDKFLEVPILNQDLMLTLLQTNITSSTPVILISAPGFDPSGRVVSAANATGKSLSSIALGSEEGYVEASKAIQAASRHGTWVLLKNVHLASTKWLAGLEKMMFRLKQHEKFRLFLTMEFKDKVPANLLRLAYKFVFEPPVGLRASLERTMSSFIVPPRTEKEPVGTRNRLYFLVAFLHAVVLERKRFAPVGWTKAYEFSDADLQCSLEQIDEWLDATGSSDPDKLPWMALKTLVRDVVYGGRLDNEIDRRVLHSFVERYFTPELFEENVPLSAAQAHAKVGRLTSPPLARTSEGYVEWIRSLPTSDHPSWIGLASHADRLLAADLAVALLTNWAVLNNRSAEELKDLLPESSFTGGPAAAIIAVPEKLKPATPGTVSRKLSRMSSSLGGGRASEILNELNVLMSNLPAGLKEIFPKQAEGAEDPAFRLFENEVKICQALLQSVKEHIEALRKVAMGEGKFTNLTREIAARLVAGEIPGQWKKADYGGPADIRSLMDWVLDLNKRVEHLALLAKVEYGGGKEQLPFELEAAHEPILQQALSELSQFFPDSIEKINVRYLWPGALSKPRAYFSATQQKVAQIHQWPVDDLVMSLDIGNTTLDSQSFVLAGLFIAGATWNSEQKRMQLSEIEVNQLPASRLRWSRKVSNQALPKGKQSIKLPIFLTRSRSQFISFVELTADEKEDPTQWYQRGVALILWWSI
eukprot:Gregarina_sp_Poly_1__3173@NODE_18_length_21885_cov_39_980383_g16_i0_p1_GENE_NODE_18_length_21885_cov_39_980383_g16_i0NODE_18_length_21885_cov_39_980383_g16_i0_p1_ORF_typecomplete_len4767_score865_14AAA_6/PF12774_7/1_5e149AAA_6/PF12774_7/8_3e02AAA_6/PF12774_7/9_7DHC_N2/PF08393_13/4_2e02DHC_N2/PF08393_13/9_6e02DHC_N2/PF08393_13/4_6e02DHC_N2/PF08393_13/2_6e02DHC_N2/PF08393_13/1_9e118AAA_8/PF12780_7/2_6e03AAA_8/PF12780_7/5_6e02AAA_8/PF12780_7/7_5AAA_8/PF12780_7/2_2e91DHC_N1/PF08385_12/1_1e85DHC_N1/P